MFCPNCGTQIAENGAFCPNCGNKLNNETVNTPVTPVTEKPKKAKKRKGKVIAAIISVLVVIAVAATVIIINPFGDKGGNSLGGGKKENQWYVAERTNNQTYSEDYSYKYQYKYLDKVQLLETTFNGEITTYTYDNNNRLMSMESEDNDLSFKYEEKGSKYVGTSNTYKDDDDSYYMVVKYNRANQLVLQETYHTNRIETSVKYSYHPNGEISQYISTYNEGDYFIETFNENGQATLVESYNADGTLTNKQVFEYDGKRVIGTKYYDKNGELSQNEVLDDKNGNRVKTIMYDEDNEVSGYSEYIYDENDHLVERKIYDKDNKLVQHMVNVWRIMK